MRHGTWCNSCCNRCRARKSLVLCWCIKYKTLWHIPAWFKVGNNAPVKQQDGTVWQMVMIMQTISIPWMSFRHRVADKSDENLFVGFYGAVLLNPWLQGQEATRENNAYIPEALYLLLDGWVHACMYIYAWNRRRRRRIYGWNRCTLT